MEDWIGLGVLVAIIGAVILARRRVKNQTASAMAAVRFEGFEAGRAAVLASIGSTVVVSTNIGNSGTTGDDNNDVGRRAIATVLSDQRTADAGVHGDIPRSLRAGDNYGDLGLRRAEALSDVQLWPRDFDDAARLRRPPGDGPGRGPGE